MVIKVYSPYSKKKTEEDMGLILDNQVKFVNKINECDIVYLNNESPLPEQFFKQEPSSLCENQDEKEIVLDYLIELTTITKAVLLKKKIIAFGYSTIFLAYLNDFQIVETTEGRHLANHSSITIEKEIIFVPSNHKQIVRFRKSTISEIYLLAYSAALNNDYRILGSMVDEKITKNQQKIDPEVFVIKKMDALCAMSFPEKDKASTKDYLNAIVNYTYAHLYDVVYYETESQNTLNHYYD